MSKLFQKPEIYWPRLYITEPDYGFNFDLQLDPLHYADDELQDIAEMLSRVMQAYWNRKKYQAQLTHRIQ